MADPKSTGSGAGVDNAQPSADSPPPLRADPAVPPADATPAGQFLSLIQQLAGQAVIVVSAIPPRHPTVDRFLSSLERFAADAGTAIAGIRDANFKEESAPEAPTHQPPPRKPPGTVVERVEDDDEDEDEDDKDDDERLGVDDVANLNTWHTPLQKAIDAEVSRLHLLDSLLAGVDGLFETYEGHLAVQRVSRGDPQDALCLCRRIIDKMISNFDSIRIGPLVEQEREAAIAGSREARPNAGPEVATAAN